MKKILSLFLMVTLFVLSYAQQVQYEEVVYLKNGNIYRGTIVEQVPGVSLKIETADRNVFSVSMTEVVKITKERIVQEMPAPKPEHQHANHPGGAGAGKSCAGEQKGACAKGGASCSKGANGACCKGKESAVTQNAKEYVPLYKRKRGYWGKVEARLGIFNAGIRMVHGVRFGRLGQLGIGVGIEGAANPRSLFNIYGDQIENGIYLPLYLHYQGDILKGRHTPFYFIEAGWAANVTGMRNRFNEFPGGSNVGTSGGPLATAGIGYKLNSKRRVSFQINLHVNMKSNFINRSYSYYDEFGNYFTTNERKFKAFVNPGIGIGIGF